MSTLNSSRKAIDDMVSDLRKDHKLIVNLVGLESMKNKGGFARVTASVASNADPKSIIDAISDKLSQKMRPVADSFHVLASNDVGKVVTGIYTTNPVTVAYQEGDEGFKALSGNMFMDDEENLWALRKTDAGDILVKSMGSEDADIIGDLLPVVASSGLGTMAYEATASAEHDNSARSNVEGGDFITFVNPETESVAFGVVVAGVAMDNGKDTDNLIVQSSTENEGVVSIDNGMIVSVIEGVDTGDLVSESSVAPKSMDEIAAYYKQMFIRDPSYYESFMNRFKSHVFA